jgi:hypothetical protein
MSIHIYIYYTVVGGCVVVIGFSRLPDWAAKTILNVKITRCVYIHILYSYDRGIVVVNAFSVCVCVCMCVRVRTCVCVCVSSRCVRDENIKYVWRRWRVYSICINDRQLSGSKINSGGSCPLDKLQPTGAKVVF